MTEDNAVTEALRQFGGAEDFARQWQREWQKTPPQAVLREIMQATRGALLLSLPALLIGCIGSPVWSRTIFLSQFAWAPGWMHSCGLAEVTSGWASFGLDFIILPLAVGASAGRLIPQRAGLGMLAALTVEIILTDWYFLPAILKLGWFAERLTEQIFICSIFWLPTACLSASLSGWWTQRGRRHRKALA